VGKAKRAYLRARKQGGHGASAPLPTLQLKTSNQEETMIKVSVMYPNNPGVRFDHDYYRDKHMPLVKSRMGDKCKYYTIDKGLAGGAPGAPATYVGMCHIFADSIEAFQAGFGPHAKEILADIKNYTDAAPVMQISEVVVEK
jgi:uncharacterized protein (TIGR02118 family)